MFVIRRDQYKALAEATFKVYTERIVERLSEPFFEESRQRRFPKGCKREDMIGIVRKLIDDAEGLGFVKEGEVTPFVIIQFSLPELCRENGLEDWIETVLRAGDISPEERIAAAREILPEPERSIVFRELPNFPCQAL